MKLYSIRKFRKSKKLTQSEMADIIGVSRVNYSKKEAGNIKFSLPEATAIANHFGVSIEDVFFENDCSSKEQK